MKADNFLDFAVSLKDKVSTNTESDIVFKSLCIDIAYLSTFESNKNDYTLYFLFNEYTTAMVEDFEIAKSFRNKGLRGVYVIKRENCIYSLIYTGDKLEF